MPTTTWELHHPHRRVHRLPILVIGLVVLPYSLQLLSVPISDEGYQRHLHAWGPRPRETRECTDVAYPRRASSSTENGVLQTLFKSLVNLTDLRDELWHLSREDVRDNSEDAGR